MKNEKELPKPIKLTPTQKRVEKRKQIFQEIQDYNWLQFCHDVKNILFEFCNKRSFDNKLQDLNNSDFLQNDKFFSDETLREPLSKTFVCGVSWDLGSTRYDHNEKRYESVDLPSIELELTSLNKILELYWPDITCLQYKELNRVVVINSTGGKTSYGYECRRGEKSFYLFKLFEYLQELGKL